MAHGLKRPELPNSARAAQPPSGQSLEDVAHLEAHESPTHSQTDGPGCIASSVESSSRGAEGRFAALSGRIRTLVRAIQDNDEAAIEAAILRLSRSRRMAVALFFKTA